jgi:hypothetical protein
MCGKLFKKEAKRKYQGIMKTGKVFVKFSQYNFSVMAANVSAIFQLKISHSSDLVMGKIHLRSRSLRPNGEGTRQN